VRVSLWADRHCLDHDRASSMAGTRSDVTTGLWKCSGSTFCPSIMESGNVKRPAQAKLGRGTRLLSWAGPAPERLRSWRTQASHDIDTSALGCGLLGDTDGPGEGKPNRSRSAGCKACVRNQPFYFRLLADCNSALWLGSVFNDSDYSSSITLRTLFFEQCHLALVVGGAASWAAGGADYGQDRQGVERGAGDEDSLRIGALVGRVYQVAFRQVLG
jgi:hypothetical protein